ncbi:hypothetical protein SI65_06131 [Aspergillus cristatus]|uniref:Carrier domain-containing protein n=1 Tax=Aspergillus cristatus TaxID=573508 RepID=A0A1E3BBB5_ASPCR|nr:hypothetical protein SI65_06131 [Aspergillus cristatus]
MCIFCGGEITSLTASGKTNRKAISDLASKLTVLELTGASNKKEHKEPTTTTAKALRTLWAHALDTNEETISADNSFVQLGGSSIEAMKLVNLARNQNIGLSVADIFMHPQLDKMADASVHLKAQVFDNVPFSLVSSQGADLDDLIETAATQCYVGKSTIEDLYPCTAMQEGLMALSDSRDGAYIAHHTLPLGQNINLARFKQACQEVVTAHPILRTRFIYPEGSGALQAVL